MNATWTARPAGATETTEFTNDGVVSGFHRRTITVNSVDVNIDQLAEEPTGSSWNDTWGVSAPLVDLSHIDDVDAEGCRDLATALLQAADLMEGTG